MDRSCLVLVKDIVVNTSALQPCGVSSEAFNFSDASSFDCFFLACDVLSCCCEVLNSKIVMKSSISRPKVICAGDKTVSRLSVLRYLSMAHRSRFDLAAGASVVNNKTLAVFTTARHVRLNGQAKP